MKKHNWIFLGECAIVMVMLALVAVLIKDEKREIQGRETLNTVVAVSESAEPVAVKEYDVTEKATVKEKEISAEVTEDEKVSDESFGEDNLDSKILEEKNEEDTIKIVVFGDSIWADGRGEDGISEQVMEQLDVEIYNCAIGGTAAALDGEKQTWENWDSRSFNGMMYVATDIIEADELMPSDAACEVIKNVDFEEVDYVIVSYGLNDYFSDIPIYPQEYYDLNSYVGALRHGIQKLREEYPNLEFIITSPTYCEWFAGERQFELGDYVEAARGVAEEMDVHFLDMYHAFSKDVDKKMEYLEDGVHLTEEGRWLYSRSVIDCLESLRIQNSEKQE